MTKIRRKFPDHPGIFRADPDEMPRNFPGSTGNFSGGYSRFLCLGKIYPIKNNLKISS